MIRGLPKPVSFSITGIAFFDAKLFIGCNLGMIEVANGRVNQAYQFQSSDSVVSGPRIDRANRLLWAMDDHTHELLRFDGKTWTRMEEPLPAKGYLSRGDVLEGIKPTGGCGWLLDRIGRNGMEVGSALFAMATNCCQPSSIRGLQPDHRSAAD